VPGLATSRVGAISRDRSKLKTIPWRPIGRPPPSPWGGRFGPRRRIACDWVVLGCRAGFLTQADSPMGPAGRDRPDPSNPLEGAGEDDRTSAAGPIAHPRAGWADHPPGQLNGARLAMERLTATARPRTRCVRWQTGAGTRRPVRCYRSCGHKAVAGRLLNRASQGADETEPCTQIHTKKARALDTILERNSESNPSRRNSLPSMPWLRRGPVAPAESPSRTRPRRAIPGDGRVAENMASSDFLADIGRL
jgi:hypothetical protein